MASAHNPPYTATLLGDKTSGKSQWSKLACRKLRAADLYRRHANSEIPAAHLRRVKIALLLSLPYKIHQNNLFSENYRKCFSNPNIQESEYNNRSCWNKTRSMNIDVLNITNEKWMTNLSKIWGLFGFTYITRYVSPILQVNADL